MANAWKLGPEAESLLDKTGQVCQRVIGPAASAVDKEARFPKEGIAALQRPPRRTRPFVTARRRARRW